MFRRVFPVVLIACLTVAGSSGSPSLAQQVGEDPGWPRQIDHPEATIVVYQPEPESFSGNDLNGRAAVSVTPRGEADPIFGVVWMSARIETDREARNATILDLTVENVRFPNAPEGREEQLADILEREIPTWQLDISLDRLLTSLELAETARATAENIGTDPPAILVVTDPAVLIPLDGEPRMLRAGDTSLMRVINTPFTVLFSPGENTYYLYAGNNAWYTAPALDADWEFVENRVPAEVAALAPPEPEEAEEVEGEEPPEEAGEVAPPRIIVATEPTELIVVQGEPEYTPLQGTSLLYVANSESDILLEIQSQRHFVILSGRWYASRSLEGPWIHVTPGGLPEEFERIPPESEMGHLLASVPGTDEANEAVLDQQIPQTAAIDRSAALEVEYDGDPSFEPITGTDMEYAVNTSYQVLRIDGRYYACHEAVWFVADDPEGPWAVATSRPDKVEEIPPDNPNYNVKYVYVYDVTPTVVYVGYTPGYTYSYVYGGTVVYGTGYVYVPWYATVYYPRPATWGFHVRYNPWYGWSYGFSYSTGTFTFTISTGGWYRGGWWGPAGHHAYRRGYHRGWHRGYRAGARAGYRAGRRSGARNNIYTTQTNRGRTAARSGPSAGPAANRPANVANRPNNVFSDRNGNVFQRGQDGSWRERTQQGWERGAGSAGARGELDRSAEARSKGTERTSRFQQSRERGRGRRGG